MNLLKAVLKQEVFPALGCTEPIALAYASGLASRDLKGDVDRIKITVDPGVYKNGFAVTVPNTGGQKGNRIAATLGALIKRPELQMQILKPVTPEHIKQALQLIKKDRIHLTFDSQLTELTIDVHVTTTRGETARVIIRNAHTHVVYHQVNDKVLLDIREHHRHENRETGDADYKTRLKASKFSDFLEWVQEMDSEDSGFIQRGIEMNLEIAEAGKKLDKVGHYVSELLEKGYLVDDVFTVSKILTASATDARMAGLNYPVMASGGSGNQGIVAILVPYSVGLHYKISQPVILQSIALSHLINSYIKCYTGDLSVLCGCAVAAGAGAAVAIVFQQYPEDLEKMTLALNTVLSDLGGMLCDGAKGGCALKVASSTDSAIRAAYMALNGHGITHSEGFVGRTAEETVAHLGQICHDGMSHVDETMLDIMLDKTLNPS